MKNMTIRQKMIPLYIVISIFTFLLFFVAYFMMSGLVSDEAEGAMLRGFAIAFPIYLVIYFICIFAIGRTVTKQVAFPAKALATAAEKIAQGDVEVHLDYQSKDEMGELTASFNRMVAGIRQQADVLKVTATGDYTLDIPVRGEQDAVNRAIFDMLQNNNRLVSDIRASAHQVASGAQQIAQTSTTLSQGSTEQAASVQEFSATLAGVMAQSAGNATAAQQALEVTREAGDQMTEGIRYMGQVSQAMASIDESSQRITNVIKVIDDIAFQTNILALNAAVEAARAGQHGKGFAVVADEVRSLASKSAEAAKQTTELIESSRASVTSGSETVEKTNVALGRVGELASQTFELVQSIARDSEEQAEAINQLNVGIDQISAVVQSNSATAEESAASAQEMSAQAAMLDRIVARFRLKGDTGGQAALPPAQH